MTADQAGISYADQLSTLLKAAPYFIDYALTLFQEGDETDYRAASKGLNMTFGSASGTSM
jgi:hypothetical protein